MLTVRLFVPVIFVVVRFANWKWLVVANEIHRELLFDSVLNQPSKGGSNSSIVDQEIRFWEHRSSRVTFSAVGPTFFVTLRLQRPYISYSRTVGEGKWIGSEHNAPSKHFFSA